MSDSELGDRKRKADELEDGKEDAAPEDTEASKGDEASAKEDTADADSGENNDESADAVKDMEIDGVQKETSEPKATVSEPAESKDTANSEEEKKIDGDEKTEDAKTATDAAEKKESPNGDAQQLKPEGSNSDNGANKSSNQYESLRWTIVENDGRSESLIKLVALKSLFAKQLPKMPRAYIARLVFDRRHISLVILSDDPALKDTDEEVIGSICYFPFPEMRFAEIAFCAVNATHQVKGYGTKLMNLVKKEGARTGIEYFITYADNYAIGYFKKQGFSKTVSMPKGRYQGLIKDYDGGTMMECYVHPSIDFTRIPEMLATQRKFLLDRIRLKANSHKVYDPLPQGFTASLEGVSRANEAAARAMGIPGMAEAGWTMGDLLAATGQGKDVDRAKSALKSELLNICRKVEEQQFAWPFREPVDTSEVKDYLEVIKEPIDLLTIDKRIRKGDHYKSKQMLYTDMMLMVNNCKLYNEETSTYVQCAISLEKYLGALFNA